MGEGGQTGVQGAGDFRLSGDALDMVVAAHLEQRELFAGLDALARAPDPVVAGALAEALPAAVALHLTDEEEDLFPTLRRRAAPEDGLDATLARLSRDHVALGAASVTVVAALGRMTTGPAHAIDLAALSAFAAVARRHVLFENAVVLPLARVRLRPADRRALAERMAARRGVCLLPVSRSDA
jgi:hypothetical protein